MTLSLPRLRLLSSFLIPVALMAAGFGVGMAAEQEPSLPTSTPSAASIISSDVRGQSTSIRIAPAISEDKTGAGATSSVMIALPRSATTYQITAQGADASVPGGIMWVRGRPVIKAVIGEATSPTAVVTVSHNGNWDEEQRDPGRFYSPAMDAAFGQTFPVQVNTNSWVSGGSYVIIYTDGFENAVQPLVEWKTRKGLRVQSVSTSVTGSTTESIKAWLQDAYDNAEFPPEYVLLAGDIGGIPTYSFHGNPSDLPYILLDGDDWLPDAMIGRLPADSEFQVATMVNKIIAYERTPDMEDTSWFTNAVGVVGQYGSDTPLHTVKYCMDRLETIGFAAADTSNYLPPPGNYGNYIVADPQPVGPGLAPWGISAGLGPDHIKTAIDAGSSIVVYRGWAYGAPGWDRPAFTVTEIPTLENGPRQPVVLSFVCLTGDYTFNTPCLGEAFVREGGPEDPNDGAIAFIGNGEHWSHTRYNDAMAMSFFERIVDQDVTTLGTLMNAGKMRFMDFFPHEMEADEFAEESVEFYFHIYNLLGDPELNFWKQAPVLLSVLKPASVTAGQNSLTITVYEEGTLIPVPNARVGVVQGDHWLGSGMSDASGEATFALSTFDPASPLELTVTGSGLHPYETIIGTETALAFLGLSGMEMDDGTSLGTGNGDGLANPGEILSLEPVFTNAGSGTAAASTVQLSILSGNASIITGSSALGSLASGSAGTVTSPLAIQLAQDAVDGEVISLGYEVSHGENHDLTSTSLTVHAPMITVLAMTLPDGSQPIPGQTSGLVLTLQNDGSAPTSGGTITLQLNAGGDNSLVSSAAQFGSMAPGASVVSETGISLDIATATATGTNLSFNVETVFSENSTALASCALVVGPVDINSPVGPDDYGYYAYDSADYDYPAKRPVYQWQEISTAFGGAGTAVDVSRSDNSALDLIVDVPFGSFQYYGQDFSQIRISDNGWIAFDTSPFFNFYNWTIPTTHGNSALIAPFWDNLDPYVAPGATDPGQNGVFRDGIYTYHDSDNGLFIVEWSRLPHSRPEVPGLFSFQVILLDPAVHPTASSDGEIVFMYRQVNNIDYVRNYATVGIESPDGEDGLQLSYGGINANGMAPLQSGLAIKLSTEAPVRVPYQVDGMTAFSAAGGNSLAWSVSDTRPVIGWHVDRIVGSVKERLTEQPLAGAARSFVDVNLPANSGDDATSYQLTALHPYGATSQPGEATVQSSGSLQLSLYAAQPNPARGESILGFALPHDAVARLKVYDIAGRCVRTLLDGTVSAGEEFIIWDGRDTSGQPVAGGIYFYRLETGGQTLTRKLTFVR